MRWQFIDPKNRTEAMERSAVLARIDSWWREFQAKAEELDSLFSNRTNWDLPKWMGQHLQAIHAELMWEFGPAVRGIGHRLVITPESAHYLRPLVRSLLDRAPVLNGWEFYEYRLAEDVETARHAVEARTGCDINNFTVRASRGDENRIDLEYTAPNIPHREDRSSLHAAFVATETLLGEQCLNNWIGAIEISPTSLTRNKSEELRRFLVVDRLRPMVHALIGAVRDQLPDRPHYGWVEGAQWAMFKLEPKQADDYCEQDDLLVGKSANETQWMAAHSRKGLFCSERFSRCGETFCYVKLDGSQGLDEESFADKSEIEDALDAVLKPAGLGCHIGGGTGLRYSYVDLALTDVDKGIEAVRQRLQVGKVPKRSWIQFFDTDLAAEWVGVHDDSPAPPLRMEP